MLNDLLYNVHVVYCQSNWGWPQVAYCPSRDFYTSLSRSISYFLKFDIVWLGGGESCCFFFFKKTNNRFCSLLPNSFGFHFCERVETYLNFLGVKKDAQAKKIQDTAIYVARQTLKYELEANLGSVGSIFELTT